VTVPACLRISSLLLLALSANAGRLMDAVQKQDHTAVAKLAVQDANQADPDGTTALIYAAHLNDVQSVDLLLKAGAKADAINAYGVSALSEAVASGSVAMVEKLLAAGASANTTSLEGEPVLMTAARAGNTGTVALLLKHGASADAREAWKGQTALMWASALNHAETVRVLADHGVQVNARSALVTPEIPRPANGNLVSQQPRGGLTALLFAAREGSLEAARALIQAKADLNLADPDGITPTIMAIINAHYDVAGALIDAGADPNLADKWGRTPLYAAVDMNTLEPSTTRPQPKESGRLTGLDIERMLLERGAAADPKLTEATPGRGIPDGPDPLLRPGSTPFLRAAKTGDVASMRLLLAHGADPKATTVQGVNALMAAAGQGWRYGDSFIPESDALEGVKLCIELGLDVNAANEKKETALHGAADRGANSIVRYLVEHGARLDVKDFRGHTPLDVATGGEVRGHPGSPSTAALIREYIAKTR
jgi:uncharacterized protein